MRKINWVTFAIVAGLSIGSAVGVYILGTAEIAHAQAAETAGQFAQASVSYERAAQLLPFPARKRDDLWGLAASSSFRNGNYDRVISNLGHVDSLSEDEWITLAWSHLIQEDLSASKEAFEDGLQSFPSSARLYYGLAAVYRMQGDWTNEKLALEDQLRADENHAYAHYRLGLLLSFLDREDALAELTRASTLDTQFAPAVETMRTALNIADTQTDEAQKLVTVGRALGLVQEWDLAAAAFLKATEADPQNAEAWAWLGEAEGQTGADGSAALDQALALDGQSPIVRALRALHWSRHGDYERMRAEYSLAARLEPENPAWQAALGDADLKLGDLAAAVGHYKRAAELAPENATYWRLLAMTCAENGVAVEDVALPAALKAAELAPNDAAVLDALGFTYYSSGRYASAEETLKAAIALDADFYGAYLHLALNYLVQGNNPAAYEALVYVRDHDMGADGNRARQLLAQHFP